MSSNTISSTYQALQQSFNEVKAQSGGPNSRSKCIELHKKLQDVQRLHHLDGNEDLEKRQRDADVEEAAVRGLEAELRELQDAATAATTAAQPSATALKSPFVSFCAQLTELRAHLVLSRTIFKSVLAKSLEDVREEKVCAADLRFCDPVVWKAKERFLVKTLAELSGRVDSLPVQLGLEPEKGLLEEVQRLAIATANHVSRAADMRTDRDEELKLFFEQCNKLTGWCRQQLVNLDAMEEPDHIQEYSATLVENYSAMSHNFSVLLESVKEYVRANNVSVRRALLEADELWFYLQISTLERLSQTLYEIHPTSPVENETTTYSTYPERVATFIADAKAYLQSSASSSTLSSNTEASAVLADCEEVASLVRECSDLPAETRRFASRARAGRAGYQCLRDAVLTRLTFITSASDTVVASKQRQDEFETCVRDLKLWASEVSRGDSWRDIYSKIVEVKRMIKQEQQALDARSQR